MINETVTTKLEGKKKLTKTKSGKQVAPFRFGNSPALSADTGRMVRPDSSVSSFRTSLFLDPEFVDVDAANLA